MSAKSEALRHADKLDAHEFDEPHGAAAELRRQHEEIDQWRVAVTNAERERDIAGSQRTALLEALQFIAATDPVDAALDPQRAVRIARVAIAKAEEST